MWLYAFICCYKKITTDSIVKCMQMCYLTTREVTRPNQPCWVKSKEWGDLFPLHPGPELESDVELILAYWPSIPETLKMPHFGLSKATLHHVTSHSGHHLSVSDAVWRSPHPCSPAQLCLAVLKRSPGREHCGLLPPAGRLQGLTGKRRGRVKHSANGGKFSFPVVDFYFYYGWFTKGFSGPVDRVIFWAVLIHPILSMYF